MNSQASCEWFESIQNAIVESNGGSVGGDDLRMAAKMAILAFANLPSESKEALLKSCWQSAKLMNVAWVNSNLISEDSHG